MIIDGIKIAREKYDKLREEINLLKEKPTLGVVFVGDNPSSERYIHQKEKWAQYVGINFKLFKFDNSITEKELLEFIKKLNTDDSVDGFIVQLPLPEHIDSKKVIYTINHLKDVDGFTDINIGRVTLGDNDILPPCTAKGVLDLLDYYDINLVGKQATVVGKGNIAGKPISLMLANAGATVISCDKDTKDISKFTKNSDIVVSATGVPGLIKKNMIRNKAVIIDVGFTVIDNQIYGDCEFDKLEKDTLITPVPGGVGPMTVCILMENTLKAYRLNKKST